MKSKQIKNLHKHYGQAWEYARNLTPRPKYVILCNFAEFWIYDFDKLVDTPIDIIPLVELPERLNAFTFMEYSSTIPNFRNSQVVEVTKRAGQRMGELFQKLKARSGSNFTVEEAQRFVLQSVLTMFAQWRGLLPENLFTNCIQKCLNGESTYDILSGSLFQEMNNPGITKVGMCKGVDFFNGGLFATIPQIELRREELEYLEVSAQEDWGKVRPAIFGNIFQSTVDEKERHVGGIHFTSENDIMKIIRPTITKYWEDKIEAANTVKELEFIRTEMRNYQVLDPACGSGNFLYMAYQELKLTEQLLLDKLVETSKSPQLEMGFVTPLQFYGIDNNSFAVELARVTLTIARKVAIDKLGINETVLPLDTLNKNIVCQDALFSKWPQVNAIIGNPPFQSKNKMQAELGRSYINKLREKYSEVPGRADYCVYWLRKSHDELPENGRAGLVGTNTIRQNYSREGGLDYIVNNSGTITEAVSSQPWSGDAVVHVSIVNWVKGKVTGKKKLYNQIGDKESNPWEIIELDYINSALSTGFDVTQAKKLKVNANSQSCYQGQTHGHEGFLLTTAEATEMIISSSKNSEVIFPYLTGDNLLSSIPPQPQRYVIDFYPREIDEAKKYKLPFQRIKKLVLPTRESAAKTEIKRNETARKNNPKAKVNRHHQNFLAKWWLLSYPRPELIGKIEKLSQYIVCCQVTKRPIFEFINSAIRPNAALIVFPLSDNYSFGVLQSSIHWHWFTERCSTLKGDFRYTSNSVFDTFPWPQNPTLEQVINVASAAVELIKVRRQFMDKNQISLREIYQNLEQTKNTKLHQVQENLDSKVRSAYGIKNNDDPLKFLFELNLEVANREANNQSVIAPGIPPFFKNLEFRI
ncbi:MAG: class I SAM-dependent DNA methyltransferase [Okeania sp. SIO3B3]|nr:class I SAM-dependent DNA methyltransferase [Okeania sp. SIO3B3]